MPNNKSPEPVFTEAVPSSAAAESASANPGGWECGRDPVAEVLEELRRHPGEEGRKQRILVLRAARERRLGIPFLGILLLRELFQNAPVTEVGEVALELSESTPEDHQDCILVQQCLMADEKIDRAVDFTRRAVARYPNSHHLWHNLGVCQRMLGRLTESLEAFRAAVGSCPYSEVSLTMAGSVLRELGCLDEALEFQGAAVRCNPKSALALYNLGNALLSKEDLASAVVAYKRALELRADWPELLNNLSATLARLDRHTEAIPYLLSLCKMREDSEVELARLSLALREANRPAEALELAEILVGKSPKEPKYRMLKGASLVRVGRAADAVKEYQRAMELNPDDMECCNSMIYASNYLPYERPEELFALYRQFGGRVAALGHVRSCGTPPLQPFPRKLRIGYVSGDFCHHPVTTFIEPVLEAHNRSEFEVFCYYNHSRVDAFTRRIQSRPLQWRVILGLSDEAFCTLVQNDRIDVLVDLSGHTARNRLTAFARKPARVQLTMVGCMQTTGLDTIDYRVTDEWLDPVGLTEGYHSERLIRMRSGAVCFSPHPSSPEVSPSPFLQGAPFTFGSFNNMAKVTPPVLDLWAAVLASAPQARMQVVADSEEFFLREMEKRGIGKERFVILRRMAEVQYLEAHAAVDLLLDTFPFNGLTITSNALWMGVPCVTLSGNTSASRAGTSLLSRLGLEQFVTRTEADYLRVAVDCANNPNELVQVRAELREKMRRVWADGEAYTRELEAVLKDVWERETGQRVVSPTQEGVGDAVVETPASVSSPASPHDCGGRLTLAGENSGGVALPGGQSEVQVAASNSFELVSWVNKLASLGAGEAEAQRPDALRYLLSLEDPCSRLMAVKTLCETDTANWRQLAVCGELFARMRCVQEAGSCFGPAMAGPTSSSEWAWLGDVFIRAGCMSDAVEALKKACLGEGVTPVMLVALGLLLLEVGEWREAEPHFRRAVGLSPSRTEAYFGISDCLYRKGDFRGALQVAEPVFRTSEDPKMLLNLAAYHEKCGNIVEAIVLIERAREKNPDSCAAYMNLGNCFLVLGMLDATLAAYQKGLSLSPDSPHLHSNLLHTLTYSPEFDQPTAFARHREFARKFEAPLLPHKPHSNTRDPERRLKIAYVSPDLRSHSVVYFVEPMLQNHDHSKFEVFGVPSYTWRDGVTDRLRSHCDQWIDAGIMSDEALAEALREAGIDIVVDLICHSNHSRVLMLARKPAPLQVTMIGMQQTTGLDSVDYRVTDAVMDPPGMTEQFHSEKLLRLPVAFVFNPPAYAPVVEPLPALKNGFVTFGSLNNFAKVNDGVRDAWIRVLKAVPNSRFICLAPQGTGLEAAMAEAGVGADRLVVSPRLHMVAYLELHHQIDFVLDTFPFAGLTVSAMAAWMGVPTLTIAGKTSAARAGASLQHSLGLDEFIAQNPDDFVEKAVKIASDFAHLAEVRASMRERMAVQFTDGEAYMRSFEAGLRQAWREWCAQNPEPTPGGTTS
jgi:protein O-GlcNAc transferase